jgi:hypothetical protein
MRPTCDGNLLIRQSSTNRIILVTLPPATTQSRVSPCPREPGHGPLGIVTLTSFGRDGSGAWMG